jgi:hypothetical protein
MCAGRDTCRTISAVRDFAAFVGLLSLADVAREAKREESHVERPAIITAAVVGSTVAVISEPRGTDREVVVATS